MEYKLELHEFFVEGGNREKSHVLLHITEPSTPAEKQRGYFFAVCETNNASSKDIVKLQNIIDDIENRYYEAPQSINEHPLETVLKTINRENQDSADELQMHCLVGVVRDEQIVFSSAGTPKMLLIYQTKDGLYKKMDLIASDQEKTNQLFSQIVEGKVTPRDYIFISTPALKEFFDDDRLQKIITTRPARQSAQHIEKVLSDVRNEVSFGGLIIHLKEANQQTISPKRTFLKGGSAKSLNNLFATEKHTSATLSPSLFPKMSRGFASFSNEAAPEETLADVQQSNIPQAEINSSHLRQYQAKKTTPIQTDVFKTYLLAATKGTWTGLQFLARFIMMMLMIIIKIIVGLGHLLALLFFVTFNYQNRRRNILDNWSKEWKNFKIYLKNLPKATKVLFGASALTLLIFVGTVFSVRSHQLSIAAEKQAQETIRQIIVHKNNAESAMIYKDDTTILNETQAARQLLAQLNCKVYTSQCKDLGQQLDSLLSQIRKETVATPDLVYDWSPSKPNLKYLNKINNKILAFSDSSSTVTIYDLLTKQTKTIPGPVGKINDIAIPKENDYAAILFDNKNIAIYSPANDSFQSIDVTYPRNSVNITNILVYNRRLYSLDTLNNQIYKHENIKNGFGPGKEWLKDLSANLKNSVSMTIDGDLFVSENNGDILKITAGVKQPFAISGLDPAIKSGTEIWTYTDKEFIYVLDSENKRLVILDKDGHLNKQITAKEWKAPIGMVIDEQNKRAFILDSDKLWQVNL